MIKKIKQIVITGLGIFSCICILSCNKSTPIGPVSVTVIQPMGGHCRYSVSPATIQTLDNLQEMRGKVGRVLFSSKDLEQNPEILKTGKGLQPVDIELFKSGNTFVPANLDSLFAASLYYSVELGYLQTKRLDPNIDLAAIVPNLSDTRIIHRARRVTGTNGDRSEISDNAEYYPLKTTASNGVSNLLNYFFSYPTVHIKEIPLGLNIGIMNHEFSHLIFQHLFYEPGIKRNMQVGESKPTSHTLAAVDEGFADYFGFLAVQDPGYFLCSFPTENRDLARPKIFTPDIVSGIESNSERNFDSHEGGAVWAAIQYEIGETLGDHQLVGKSLLKLMSNILVCSSTASNNTLNFNFADLARCHQAILSADGRAGQVAQQVYRKYLGSYGAGL